MIPGTAYPLASATPPSWAPAVAQQPLELLSDHAQCELKAASSAITLLKRNPDRPGLALRLVPLVREEAEHLHRVLRELDARGVTLGRDQNSPYAEGLLAHSLASRRHGQGFLDALLVSALIEARSHERMAALARCEVLADLHPLYQNLCEAEARHGQMFLELALQFHAPATVQQRFDELARFEADLIGGLPFAPRMHSGPP